MGVNAGEQIELVEVSGESAQPAASPKPTKEIRYHYIDGIRGVAACFTIISHSMASGMARFLMGLKLPGFLGKFWDAPMWVPGHFIPVKEFVGTTVWSFWASVLDLFFVISGVVLLRPYLRKERPFVPLTYLKKRFTRIYPTYWVALCFGAAIIWFINAYPTWYNEKGIHVQFTWWETVKQITLFNTDSVYYNLAWWSMQIEIFFYLMAPILVAIFPAPSKLSDRRVFNMIVITFVLTIGSQLLLDAFFPRVYSLTHVFVTFGRTINYPVCFLLGMLLAARDFSLRQGRILLFSGLFMYLFRWYYLPMNNMACGFAYAGFLIIASKTVSIQKFFVKPVFLWIGERSYSLFLVHLSIFYLTDNMVARITTHRGFWYGALTRGLGIPIAFLVAMVLFHTVEKRFIRGLVTEKMIWPWQSSKIKKDH